MKQLNHLGSAGRGLLERNKSFGERTCKLKDPVKGLKGSFLQEEDCTLGGGPGFLHTEEKERGREGRKRKRLRGGRNHCLGSPVLEVGPEKKGNQLNRFRKGTFEGA